MIQEREVFCEDAISWLHSREHFQDCSFVASLPDISEFPQFKRHEWEDWFVSTASLIISRTEDVGVSIFYQSDIKLDGVWIDKGYLCQKAAYAVGAELLWHKIICRAPAGIATYGRPAYSHILCFSKKLRPDVAKSTPDVLPLMGEKTWQRGMGSEACVMIAKFIRDQTSSKIVVNPFCGEGIILAWANEVGLKAIGVEKNRKRAEKARLLSLAKVQK